MNYYSPIFKQMDIQRFRRIEHMCSIRLLGEQLTLLLSSKVISENTVSKWTAVYDECFAEVPCCYFNQELETKARVLYDMLKDILEHILPVLECMDADASGNEDIMYCIRSGTEEGVAARAFLIERRTSVIIAYRNYYNSVKSVIGEDVLSHSEGGV